MNVFVVPSWYPSTDYPLNGIYVQEQVLKLCTSHVSVHVGISLWGQKDNRLLLWVGKPFQTIAKLISATRTPSSKKLLPNLIEYISPTFTWSRRIKRGNIANIISMNMQNLEAFEADFGPADIIHAHVGYPAGYIAMELARKRQIPYILTEHMGPFPSRYDTDSTGQLAPFYRQAYQQAAANIAVSPSLANNMAAMGIQRIQVIPNFVNEEYFKPAPASTTNLKQPFTFFTLGSITPEKGINQLLLAIKALTETEKSVAFRIGGEGAYSEEYKAFAKELGIENYITWLGLLKREEALVEHQKCNAFVLPSLHESMGITYVEALACGKPIIATKCGGPEFILSEANGLLIEKNDIPALATAMQHLIQNRVNYSSQRIRQDFVNRFSSQAVIPQLLQLYQNVAFAKGKKK